MIMIEIFTSLRDLIAVSVAFISMCYDLDSYKIKNTWLARCLFFITILYLAANVGLGDKYALLIFKDYILGLSAAFFASYILFRLRAIGGGDVKLMAVLGSLIGERAALVMVLGSLTVASLIGIFVILLHHEKKFHVIHFSLAIFIACIGLTLGLI